MLALPARARVTPPEAAIRRCCTRSGSRRGSRCARSCLRHRHRSGSGGPWSVHHRAADDGIGDENGDGPPISPASTSDQRRCCAGSSLAAWHLPGASCPSLRTGRCSHPRTVRTGRPGMIWRCGASAAARRARAHRGRRQRDRHPVERRSRRAPAPEMASLMRRRTPIHRAGHDMVTAFDHLCVACHGFSVLVTGRIGDEARSVLFDVGPYGEVWLDNADPARSRPGVHRAPCSCRTGTGTTAAGCPSSSRRSPPPGAPTASAPPVVDLHPDRPDQRGGQGPAACWRCCRRSPRSRPSRDAGGAIELHDEPHLLAGGRFLASGAIRRRTAYETGLAGHHTRPRRHDHARPVDHGRTVPRRRGARPRRHRAVRLLARRDRQRLPRRPGPLPRRADRRRARRLPPRRRGDGSRASARRWTTSTRSSRRASSPPPIAPAGGRRPRWRRDSRPDATARASSAAATCSPSGDGRSLEPDGGARQPRWTCADRCLDERSSSDQGGPLLVEEAALGGVGGQLDARS